LHGGIQVLLIAEKIKAWLLQIAEIIISFAKFSVSSDCGDYYFFYKISLVKMSSNQSIPCRIHLLFSIIPTKEISKQINCSQGNFSATFRRDR
jgi:hypothetical protein